MLNEFVSNYSISYDEDADSNGFRDYMQHYYDNAKRLAEKKSERHGSDSFGKLLGSCFELSNVNGNLLSSLDSMKTKPAVILYNTDTNSVQQSVQAATLFANQVKTERRVKPSGHIISICILKHR